MNPQFGPSLGQALQNYRQTRNQGFGDFQRPQPMGGGIMGGQQPQQRPVQQFGQMQRPGLAGMNFGRQPGSF